MTPGGNTAKEGISVQTLVEVRTFSFSRVGGIVCALTTGVVRRGGVNIHWQEEEASASEAVHELNLVCVVERKDWCVRIPIVLARMCAKEVMRTRLVQALGQAVKLGHLDGDWRNHGDVKVVVEHRRTPMDPQVRCGGPGVRLILERDWHRRIHVKN